MTEILCKLVPDLDVGTWIRGEECLPKVLEISKEVFGWSAKVAGQDEPWHEVNFFLGDQGEWGCECSCMHHEIKGKVCKHMVAVARILEEKIG